MGNSKAAVGILLHGLPAPSRFSPGRPHCVIPISFGAVTGRKYHYVLCGSLHMAGATCLYSRHQSLSIMGHGVPAKYARRTAKVPCWCVFGYLGSRRKTIPSPV